MRSKLSGRLMRNWESQTNACASNAPVSSSLIPASVFWDFENCQIPKNVPVSKLAPSLKTLLSKYGLFPKEIHAIGHFSRMSAFNLKALTEIGVNMTDVLSTKENAADMSILTAMAKTMHFHKPPYGIVLISGDRDFTSVMNFMDRVGYSVIIVNDKPDQVQIVLSDSPAHKEKWTPLLKPYQGLQLKILPDFDKFMHITEMLQRVKYLTGESLSEKEMIEKLPPVDKFRTKLFKELSFKDVPINDYIKNPKGLNQKLEGIFPALKFFARRFGDKSGNIYEIPESYVKECGYLDQFHWALITEYYDLLTFEKKTSIAKLSKKVVSWLQGKEDQNIYLCRFLNTILFGEESNYEAKTILSGIKNLQIGPLKMSEEKFCKMYQEWASSENPFTLRKVTKVEGDQVALTFPWLFQEDPGKNGYAIDQMNFMYQNPEFIPLVKYIQDNHSNIVDVDGFQTENTGLLEKFRIDSWEQYYSNACKALNVLEVVDVKPNNLAAGSTAKRATRSYQQFIKPKLNGGIKNSNNSNSVNKISSNATPASGSQTTLSTAKPLINNLKTAQKANTQATTVVNKTFSGEKITKSTGTSTVKDANKTSLNDSNPVKNSLSDMSNVFRQTDVLDNQQPSEKKLIQNGMPSDEKLIENGKLSLEKLTKNTISSAEKLKENGNTSEEKIGIEGEKKILTTKKDPKPKKLDSSLIWILAYSRIMGTKILVERDLHSIFPNIAKSFGHNDWDSFKAYCVNQGLLSVRNHILKILAIDDIISEEELKTSFSEIEYEELSFFSDLALLSSERKFSWISLDEISTLSKSNPTKYKSQGDFEPIDLINRGLSMGILESLTKDMSKFKMNAISSTKVRILYISKTAENINLEKERLFGITVPYHIDAEMALAINLDPPTFEADINTFTYLDSDKTGSDIDSVTDTIHIDSLILESELKPYTNESEINTFRYVKPPMFENELNTSMHFNPTISKTDMESFIDDYPTSNLEPHIFEADLKSFIPLERKIFEYALDYLINNHSNLNLEPLLSEFDINTFQDLEPTISESDFNSLMHVDPLIHELDYNSFMQLEPPMFEADKDPNNFKYSLESEIIETDPKSLIQPESDMDTLQSESVESSNNAFKRELKRF